MAGFDLGGLLSSGIGIFGGGSPRVDPNAGGFMDALNTAHQQQVAAKTYADAAMDPSSAWFKNLSSLYEDTNRANLITGLNAFFNQRQQRAARGIPMNSERVDEAGAKAASLGNWQAAQKSQLQAQEALLKGASVAANQSSGLSNFYSTLMNLIVGNNKAQSDRASAIGSLVGGQLGGGQGGMGGLQSILSMFGGGGGSAINGGGAMASGTFNSGFSAASPEATAYLQALSVF